MPELPEEAAHLWAIFNEIKVFDVSVSYQEIMAFCELTGESLSSFEVGMIKALDNAYKAELNG